MAPFSKWESENLDLDLNVINGFLYKCEKLPNANRLQIRKLSKSRLVTFRCFDYYQQQTNFFYHYLLISGCWRSEDEMMAGFSDPFEAMKYHDLVTPNLPNINPGVGVYLLFHIQLMRYNERKLKSIISILINQGIEVSIE